MRASRAVAALLFVALMGCVLVAPPLDIGDHCRIEGDTECAACIRRSCQPAIDACCASSSSSAASVLEDMDACGRGENPRCVDALSTARTTKVEEDVRACASKSCREACTKGATGSGSSPRKWTCATAREPASDCGACVYGSCSAAIDACCADTSCKNDHSIQVDVGACVAGDAPGCVYGQTDARSDSGEAGVVRKCILDKCPTRCFGDGYPHARCTLFAGGTYCSCADAEESSGSACTAKAVGGGDCVRGRKGCTCGSYECSSTSRGCSCSFTGEPGERAACSLSPSADGGECCLKVDGAGLGCACNQYSSCVAELSEYKVSSCDYDTVRARAPDAFVATCSR